jgi:glycosyltransferase involved in cell wall biosynthesis
MRIAIFHNLPSGGAKRVVYEWMRLLARTDSLDVFSLSTADRHFCDLAPYAANQYVFEFRPRRLFRSPWGRLNQLQRWRDLLDLGNIARQVADRVDAGRYDVVLTNTCLHTGVPELLQYLRTPSVHYLHEPVANPVASTFRRSYHRANRLRRAVDAVDPLIKLYERGLQRVRRDSLRKSGLLLANSQFTRQTVKAQFGLEARVCYPGVDCDTFTPNPDRRRGKSVLSVGELSPRKGFDFLVESLAQLPGARRPPLILACNRVDADEELYVRSLASRHGVELTILVGLDARQLACEYRKAAVCIYAPVAEPLGLVPLEAMACGAPVLGVGEAGVKETIVAGRTGLLVEREQAKFAQAVDYALSEPGIAEDWGRRGREYVLEKWTWAKATAELRSHLARCAAQALGEECRTFS